jgi:hypothetical protein
MPNIIASIDNKGFNGDFINLGIHILSECGYACETNVEVLRGVFELGAIEFNQEVKKQIELHLLNKHNIVIKPDESITLLGGAS